MPVCHIVGVDPGLVHTGLVRFLFNEGTVTVSSEVIQGHDPQAVADWIYRVDPEPRVYIEKYDPRQHYSTDEKMVKGEQELKRLMPKADLLRNMGVQSIVTKPVLELLGVWSFSKVSHHQDLRSAARIALLGMLKRTDTNALLATVVRDHIDGYPWDVWHV